jgi:hypothetical protein
VIARKIGPRPRAHRGLRALSSPRYTSPIVDPALEAVCERIEEMVIDEGVPSVVVTVARDGVVLWKEGYRTRTGGPLRVGWRSQDSVA